MYTTNLKPSEILYSQDTISNFFNERSPHWNKKIGETLDDICERRCTVSDIPRISVMRKGNSWIAADNRRLWIFQQLEKLGKCRSIEVNVVFDISPEKITSTTKGRTVVVRRDPGGNWHRYATSGRHGGYTPHQNSDTSDGSSLMAGIVVAGAAVLVGLLFR